MRRVVPKSLVVGLAALVALAAFVSSFSAHRVNEGWPDRVRVQSGDNPAWAAADFDDSQWLSYRDWQRAHGPYQGNLWLRQSITIRQDDTRNNFVLVAVGSSEVYWDGVLIGENGVVGASAGQEVPGSLLYLCTIPDALLEPGTHQIAMRFSNHRGISRFYLLGGGIGDLDDILSFNRRAMFPFMFLIAFLVVALYFLVLYILNRREPALLVFACLCFLTGLLLFVESVRALGYPYHFHGYRLVTVALLSGILSGLAPLFFVLRHGFSRRWALGVLPALGLGALVFHRSLDQLSFGFFLFAFLYAQVVVCLAHWRDREDAWISVLGVSQVVGVMAYSGMIFMERWLFGSFTVLLVLILISLGLQIRRQRARHQETKLRSARLQIELLQKHLQPHFVLNTLTAVMEWLEREPKAGVAFIGLLAEEMKTLNRISGLTLVPLDEELRLCRNHLEILAYRHDEAYIFNEDCPHLDFLIPPALLLTLVENGVSYALDHGPPRFAVRQWVVEDGSMCFEFKAIGVDLSLPETGDGTGTKYIKARLEESFPGRWRMDARGADATWTTTLIIERQL